MKIRTYASGSSGNCTIVKENGRCLILDCGVCPPPLLHYETIDGVLITHNHSDHIHNVMDYRTKQVYGTYEELSSKNIPCVNYVKPNHVYQVGIFLIIPFKAVHDTPNPVHYLIISPSGDSFWYGCDTSVYNDMEYIASCTCKHIMVDCNYDERHMTYESKLKDRVMSIGHCSNQYIYSKYKRYKQKLILGHISNMNNSEEYIKDVFGKVKIVLPRM